MASGRYNTMEEGLTKMLADIPGLMATPDGGSPANMEFLTDLQIMLVTKLREVNPGIDTGPATPGQQPPPPEIADLMAGPGGPGGGRMGAGIPMGGGPSQRVGGLMPRPQINEDDLNRVMNQTMQ